MPRVCRVCSHALLVLVVLGLYLLVRWWRRRAFIRQLRMNRINVDELRGLIDQGRKLLILDVRPQEAREEGMIPGAMPAAPEVKNPSRSNGWRGGLTVRANLTRVAIVKIHVGFDLTYDARRSGRASDVRSRRTGGQNLGLFLGAQENG